MLTKEDLEHLAELARIELKEKEEKKLQKDLSSILDYFQELQKVNTENIKPMTGGTDLVSVVREDFLGKTDDTGKGPEAFPEQERGFLRVPPIF